MKPLFRSSLIPTRALLVSSLFFLIAAAMETAQAQVATLSATSSSFGNVAVGSTSSARTVRLSNTSTTTALSVTSIVSSSSEFGVSNTCGTSVAAGKNCSISITFTPSALGAQTGSITVTDNATTSPQTITLTGTGVAPITITPASHNFGSVGEGTTSAASKFTVRNSQTTTAALTVSTAAPFAETDNCASVAAKSTCTISVTFSPTAGDAQTGSLTVSSATGTDSPLTATLTGTGVSPITLTPASRAFGSVAQGTTSAAKTFTVKNNTSAAMSITV
ncbi:MAG: choice-of-anchor D domain-containing protein, partial [Candidatus Sulfotelmatobacter sp.]